MHILLTSLIAAFILPPLKRFLAVMISLGISELQGIYSNFLPNKKFFKALPLATILFCA